MCVDVFTAEGAAREVAGNAPLPLDDPGAAWLVDRGPVDVFAVPLQAGQPAGARIHLFRAEAGQLLFGLVPAADGAGQGLQAVGGPGSRVLRLDRARLGELAGDAGQAAHLAPLLDGWIDSLTTGVARDRLPKKPVLLLPGKEVVVRSGAVASPGRGVLWVRHAEGTSLLLGKAPTVPGGTDDLFPVSSHGSLLAVDDVRLACATTPELLADPRLWPGLECFHQAVLACVAANARDAAALERDRVERRTEAERRLMQATLSQLAHVGDDDGDGPAAGADGDPLLAACQRVGDRLGLAIRAPAGGGEKRRRSDPISAIARASRVRVRRVFLAGDWWRQDNGPLLAFRAGDDAPVALLPRSPSRYDLVDPVPGQRTPLTAANAVTLLPFGYSFYRPFPARPLTAWDVFRFGAAGSARDWAAIVVLGLAASVLGLFAPVATGWIFDRIIPGAEHDQLLLLVLALVVSTLAGALFRLTQDIAMLRLETRMDSSVQAGVWDRLLNLPAPFFRRYSDGDLANRALGVGEVRQVLTDVALSSVLSCVFSLVSFGLLFLYDVRLALLACGLFLAVFAAAGLAALWQLPYQRQVHQARGKVTGLVLQLLSGVPRLRVARAEDRALAVWAREFAAQRRSAFRVRTVANGLAAFNAAAPVLATLALFAAVSLRPPGDVSLGTFLGFSAAFSQVLFTALTMSSAVGYLLEVVPIYERARPILEAVPEVGPARAFPADLGGGLELSRVSFRYQPDSPLVLDGVSVRVRPGEFVAFVGRSGAGKSTLIRLLLGFETPTAGSVYYDGQDLAGLDLQAVRRQIGVVLQDGRVTAGDIFGNIIGSSLLTVDDAWEAARLSGLDEDIRAMPMGMHTVVSEGGTTLSGGQRQRLLIARAVVSRPRILLFDEATSALDNETQARVSRSLEQLQATRVVVAHRLSTIRNADRIYVLDAGRVVEEGTYDELLRQEGAFAELARRQLAGDEELRAGGGG